jgi:hypothetical protein
MIRDVRRLLIVLLVLASFSPADASTRLGLAGVVSGAVSVSKSSQPPVSDSPAFHHLEGKGRTNLGMTSLSGDVHGTGFVQFGQCGGALTLSSPSGTVTLRVSSARIGGFSECPRRLTWRVTRATGGLAGSEGSGTMQLVLSARIFRLVFDGPGTRVPPPLGATGGSTGLPTLALCLTAAGLAVTRSRRAP